MQSDQIYVDLNSVEISRILQNFTVKERIAKDSYLLVRQQIGINLDMSSLEPDSLSGTTQMNMEMNATLIYYDFGK